MNGTGNVISPWTGIMAKQQFILSNHAAKKDREWRDYGGRGLWGGGVVGLESVMV